MTAAEERFHRALARLRRRPAAANGPLEALILSELGRIADQVHGLENIILARLYLALHQGFDDNELRELCYLLGVDHQELAGETRSARAQSLVTYLHRRGRVGELVTRVHELRPAGRR